MQVHSGGAAERSAQEASSQAYTVGHDLVFGPGRFAPETRQGRRLLAHELTHVVQQSGIAGVAGPVQRQTPAAAAPAKAEGQKEDAADAEAQAKRAETSGDQSLSPLRKQLLELFGKFEKKVIGDAVFEKIETEEHWKAQKQAEADATVAYEDEKKEYDSAMKEYIAAVKRGEKPETPTAPVPVAKFTPRIATQEKLLREAFKAQGLTLKKKGKKPTGFAFATTDAETAEAIAPGAWHWGKMGMDKTPNDRPKRGDIIVLAFRGGKADEARSSSTIS